MRHFHEIQDVSNPDEFLEVMSEHVRSAIILPQTSSTNSFTAGLTSEYDSMYGTWAEFSDCSEVGSLLSCCRFLLLLLFLRWWF